MFRREPWKAHVAVANLLLLSPCAYALISEEMVKYGAALAVGLTLGVGKNIWKART